MVDVERTPRTVSEWHSVQSYRELTSTQKYRKKKGLEIYERDRTVHEYKVNKGEWV